VHMAVVHLHIKFSADSLSLSAILYFKIM